MLGLQETRSPGTPTSKTYSCVACSATFQSLASLLVHQASHADEISCQPESTLPTCVTCGTLFSSADLLEKHNCLALPTPAAQKMHVCDCGEEFDASSALEEHKMLHKPNEQVSLSLDINPHHLEMKLDNKTDSSHQVSDQASPNRSPCHSNEEPLVKSASSASEADIKAMASTTDTSTVEENVKSASASEADIEMAFPTEISIPTKENVKISSSASEADIEMASTTEISIPMKENVKSSSSASEVDIEMASTTEILIPMKENVKSASASEADIKAMASTTDTSTVEENVKSASSASEADIEMASTTEISIPTKENVKSASSASEVDIKMASTTEISIPTKENVKSSSSASEADIEMASASDTSVPMQENVKSSSSASEADIEMASTTDTSVPMEVNVKSSSSASEADIEMASTTDTSVPMEVNVKSSSSASEAEIKDMASTTDISISAEKDIVNEQDYVLKPHESLLPHHVTEEKEPVLESNSDTLEPSSTSNHPEHASEESARSHKESTGCDKKSILKILASAYMSHRQPGHINPIPTKRNQPPRKVAPRAPMQFAPAITMPKSEPQKKESNTKCPEKVLSFPSAVLNVKTGKKKKKKRKIISVIQTLYPVVMLETRQKLFGKDKIEGRHKCGICRRVFQNTDNLIMHHAQHKKERVKFCFRCQQFVICAAENHMCFSTFAGNSQRPPVVENKSPTLPSPSPTTAQKQRRFQCSICKRAYIWKRNLKRHTLKGKCTPILTSSATAGNQDNGNPPSNSSEPPSSSSKPAPNSSNFPPNSNKLHSKNDSSREVQDTKENEISKHVNVGVGTETIKTEEQNTEFSIEGKNQTVLKIPPPSHKPVNQLPSPSFVSNSKPTESTKTEQNVELPANVVETEAEDQDQFEEKQWTMPLDDAEIDVLIDGDQEDMDNEDNFADVAKKDSNEDEDVVIVESPDDLEMDSLLPSNGFNVHVSDEGIKRFVCAGCQRSYSRRFTLMQHLSICGARKLKQQKRFEKTSSGVPGPLKKFPCPQCGKFFSRKDNMNMHRKRCSGTIPNPPIVPSIVENKTQPAQENLFVLSPSTETPSVRPESSRSSSSNWGIMSLPPVLPRRVTCECGASFTCPRLLFEHLQLHAQESYICPHCGENLQSWMDFEAHQQVHRQSQNQAVEQRGPQMHPRPFPQMTPLHVPTRQQPRPFSQVLQSHIPSGPQQPPGFQTSEMNLKAQPSALLPPQNFNHSPYPETVTCYRCKKTFSGRRSLLRHLRLSCRGDAAGQKKPSVQIQSNASKPTFKPLRCPVCVRWFSCLDGLKRHLVSHSRQPTLSCEQCGQNCPSYQALEEHKRNVHKVNSGIVSANVKQEQVCKEGAQSAQKNAPTDFQCHICLRYYPKLQSLKDHVRKVHRPKQPKPINLTVVDPFRSGQFQCQICMRAYPDIKSLKNHRRRVHRILGGVFQSAKGTEQNRTPDHFQCQICGSSYPDISALQNHKRMVHRVFGGLELGNHSAKPTQSVQVSNLQLS